jgi:cGMP-dependent protein kinase
MGGVCNSPSNRQCLGDNPKKSYSSREEHKLVTRLSDRRQAIKNTFITLKPISTSAKPTQPDKGAEDREMIYKALSKHILFSSLQNDMKELLVDRMTHMTVEPNAIIFEQGSSAFHFYIVATGKLEVIINGRKVNEAEPGDAFGELALIQDTQRSATLRSVVKSSMWMIDRFTFRQALESLNKQALDENRSFLKSVPQLELLTPDQFEAMLNTVTDFVFQPGQRILKEGDPGDLFFIIKEGSVVCSKDTRDIRRLGRGEFFGEQALLYGTARSATVTAVDKCRCLAVGREMLQEALGSRLEKTIFRNSIRIAMDSSPVFSNFTPAQVNQVIERVQISRYRKGVVAIPSGTPKGCCLWIVLKGTLQRIGRDCIVELGCVGDAYFVGQKVKSYRTDVVAAEDAVVAAIHKEELESIARGPITQAIASNQALKALRQIELLRSLSNDNFNDLVSTITEASFEPQQDIVHENSAPDSFFIVKSGICEVVKYGAVIRTIGKLAYFGERSMLLRENRSASVVAQTQVECWVLSQEDFFRIINERMRSLLLKRIELQDESVTLDDLAVVKVLGSGMFGKVYLTTRRKSAHTHFKRSLYALKVVEKQRVLKLETWPNLQLERSILLQMDHMFIVKLVKTLKDSQRIYFLMEYVRGMDLFDVIRELGLLKDRDAKFYIACLVLIAEYLDDREIVYRDFKPENIMIDEDGYPKLIDFGTAKVIHGRTFTVVGTPHYMAPEVITCKGYNQLADLWSIGVILYEFVCGRVPFGEDDEDPYLVYEKVLAGQLSFPSFTVNRLKCKTMIEQLLHKTPSMRTGGGGILNLKDSQWFSDICWDSLLSKAVKPPFFPKLPRMSRDIDQAAESLETLRSQIMREEALNPLDSISCRIGKAAPDDWDSDF